MREDGDLLDAWRAGDTAAGEELFERYYPAMARFFANKLGGDPADLIQDTFMACLRGRDRIAEQGKFRAYIFSIAYNQLRMHYRSKRVDAERLDFGSVSAADLSPGAGSMLVQSAEQVLLLAALRRIPIEHQVVLELFYWEDMTSATIADVLEEPHGTVRTRIRRARELLEQALGELATDPGVLRRTVEDLDGWVGKIRVAAGVA
ncbi:MAG TPA: sigma-70 family RNA polymerase sigma factor [Nannocystaceae bacterium]|nr:sigma-70 family RNA polymerase sigma factor [Nannocystaceae bacterium]